jgi:hypothetical protein
VTKARAGAAADAHTPDEMLVEQCGSAHRGLDKQKLTDTLTQFGPLPKAGQEQLIRCLVQAFAKHQLRVKQKDPESKTLTTGQQRDELSAVKAAAAKLLGLLGIDVKRIAPSDAWDLPWKVSAPNRLRALGRQSKGGITVSHWLSLSPMVSTNRDPDSINAELSKGRDEVTNSILAILRLHNRARVAVRMSSSRIRPERGGDRRRPTAKGQLIRDAIAIYKHMRERYPDSGNEPALGGPMQNFVRAVGTLFDAQIADRAIKEVWYAPVRKRKSMPQ